MLLIIYHFLVVLEECLWSFLKHILVSCLAAFLLQPRNGPSTSPTCMCHFVLHVTSLVSLISCGSILLHPEALETMHLWISLAIIRSTRSRFNFLPLPQNHNFNINKSKHIMIMPNWSKSSTFSDSSEVTQQHKILYNTGKWSVKYMWSVVCSLSYIY